MGITSLDRLAKVKEWQVKYPERIRAHQLVQIGVPGVISGKFSVRKIATKSTSVARRDYIQKNNTLS
jgi:hypothetical protein